LEGAERTEAGADLRLAARQLRVAGGAFGGYELRYHAVDVEARAEPCRGNHSSSASLPRHLPHERKLQYAYQGSVVSPPPARPRVIPRLDRGIQFLARSMSSRGLTAGSRRLDLGLPPDSAATFQQLVRH